jgi:hypothetical protein
MNADPPETTPEWTAEDAAVTTNGAKAMMERMRKEMLSTSEIATMMDRLDQLYLAFERQSVEIRRLRSEREAQGAEIAKLNALVQRVVDEHEIHDNDPLLFALLDVDPRQRPARSELSRSRSLTGEKNV